MLVSSVFQFLLDKVGDYGPVEFMAWSQVKTFWRLSFLLTIHCRALKACALSPDLVIQGHTATEAKAKAAPGFEFSYNVCFAQYYLGNSLTRLFTPQKSHGEPEWVLTWTQPHPGYQRPWTPPATVYSSPVSTVLLKAVRHLGLKEEMVQWNEPHGHTVETIHRVLDGSLSPPPRSLHHSVFSEKGRNFLF